MKTVRLSDVAEVNPRVTAELKAQPDQEIAFLPMDAVGEDGSVRYQERRLASSVLTGYTLFKKGDVLLAKITPCMENGKAAYLDGLATEFGAGSTEFHVLRPGPDLDGRFLFYLIWNPAFRAKAEGRMTGSAGQKRVPADFLRDLTFKCPPLDEQRRIAAILDKADAIRRKRQQALALADDFLRSSFLEMFGDPVTNPRGWAIDTLGDHLDYLTSGSRGWASYYDDEGQDIFIRIGNVGSNQLLMDDVQYINAPDNAEARRTRIKAGDVLLSITADLGRTAVIPADLGAAYINQHLAIIRPKGIDPLFLSQFLASRGGQTQFKQLDRAGVKSGLNFDDIRSLKIPLPPLSLQQRFAELWRRMRSASGQLGVVAHETNTLFASLSRRAFRGEL